MSAPAILVTRPHPQAEALARELAAEGWRPLLWPLLEIVALGQPPDLGLAQALILSSANAARRCAPGAETNPAPIPALCVGEGTAQAARAAGFSDARAAGGDAAALVALARASLDPAAGPLAFARGETVAADVAGALRAAGFTVEETVVYAARPATAAPDAIAAALRDGAVAAAAFYSPRTAAIFAALAQPWRAGLAGATAVAISAAAAAPLADAGFGAVIAAATPDAAGMRAAIAAARPSGAGI